MAGMVPHKNNGCTEEDAKIIAKASHVTCMSDCSRRYGSASKTKLLIGVVFKISGDKLPSGHLRFDLKGEKLRFPRLTSDPAHLLQVLY